MLKKFLSKYFMDVIPSIVATVVGAYIVTHYVNARPDADKPKAAVTAPAEAAKDAAPQPVKADDSAARAAAAAKAAEAKATEAARLKAEKLAAEKVAAEKLAAEKAAAERAEAARKVAAEKLASEKAAERREREKSMVKSAPVAKPSAEANAAPEDGRDANDLARAAIERLRSAEPRPSQPPRASDAGRVQEPVHQQAKEQPQERPKPTDDRAANEKASDVVYAPAQPSVQVPQPLPPAVTVAPAPNALAVAPAPLSAPQAATARAEDSFRPTPPADIPSRPLDLHARPGRTSVADEVVSAAKSVFQAVVPDPTN